MSRPLALEAAGQEAARAAIRARHPQGVGCPQYFAETADTVVRAYLGACSPDLFGGAPSVQQKDPAACSAHGLFAA